MNQRANARWTIEPRRILASLVLLSRYLLHIVIFSFLKILKFFLTFLTRAPTYARKGVENDFE